MFRAVALLLLSSLAFADEEPPTIHHPTAWACLGVAAVFLTTAGVLAESAQAREDDLRRLADYRDPQAALPAHYQGTVRDQYEDALSEGKSIEILSIASLALGGVTAAVAALLFTRNEPPVALLPTQDGAVLSWDF